MCGYRWRRGPATGTDGEGDKSAQHTNFTELGLFVDLCGCFMGCCGDCCRAVCDIIGHLGVIW